MSTRRRSQLPGNAPAASSGGGGGGGTPANNSVGSAQLQANAVTNNKVADDAIGPAETRASNNPSSGDLVAVGSSNQYDFIGGVGATHIDAGTATNNYVLTADSTETSGIEWKINAPADRTITPAKIADITVNAGAAGKILRLKETNHAEFELADYPTFTLSANDVTTSTIANSAVTMAKLDIDGTAEVGKIAKVYDSGSGVLKLQWADDNSGSGGGGGNVSYPINLATASNFSNDLPIAQGGTGASTAAAARVNLGVQASGGGASDQGDLPVVTELDAQAEGHIGQYVGASTNRPETGSGSGLVAKFDDDGQIAVDADEGTTWFRTHSTTVDNNWSTVGTPSPALTAVTDIAGLRAITNYQVVESTFAAGNPQSSPRCLIARFPGGFGGNGYLCAIPPGGLGFWVAEIPSSSFSAADLTWSTWEFAPLPGGGEFENNYLHRGGAYDKVPAGQTGLVLDLQIASTTVADAFVSHTYTQSTTSSSYKADFYTTGSTVRESTRGHTHAIGSWAKTQIGNDQIEDGAVDADAIDNALVIKESDGTAVSRMKVPQLEDIVLTGYTYTTNTTPAAGQVNYNSASRAFRGRARAGDEVLLAELIQTDFEFSITKTSSGQAASVRGVFNTISPVVQGVFQGQYRSDDITEVGDFTAGDTITLRGHKAVYNKLDIIPPIGLGLGHGSSSANHLVKFNASGSAFTQGHLAADNLPTVLADIRDINERLTLRQRTEPRTFGTGYAHRAQPANLNNDPGKFRWDDTNRLLSINPLGADTKLVEYLSVPGIDVELTSSNGAVIHSTVEAVVSNPAGITDTNVITVRLKNLAHHYTGDIRSGTVTVKTFGSFIGRGDTAVVQRDALDAGTGTAGQVLSRTSTGLAWVNNAGGGGGSTDLTAYSSKVFTSNYTRQATLSSLARGQYYWDSTNQRITIAPRTGDTDLTTRTPIGSRFEIRAASGTTRLDGVVDARPSNPSGTPSGVDAFTFDLSNAQQTYYKSSDFDTFTGNALIYCHGLVANWGATGSTIGGLYQSINRFALNTSNAPFGGAHLSLPSDIDSSDPRLVWTAPPVIPRQPTYFINIQSAGDSLSIANTTMQALRDGTSAYSLRMEIQNAADWVELISDGVVNCGSGSLQGVGVRLEWRFRTATSESGLSSATYEPADSQRRTFGLGDVAYQTKQAGGGTGGTSHRDLWVLSNDWMSLSHISSVSNPTTAGRWIEFELRHALPDNAFSGSTITNRYGYTIKMTCMPNTNFTDQS